MGSRHWRTRRIAPIAALVVALGGCSESTEGVDRAHRVEPPAAAGSASPGLSVGADGTLYLSWVEPAGSGHALRFSRWQGEGWSAPKTVAQGSDWFVNWADVPALAVAENGTLAASWLARTGEGTHAYGIRVSVSRDGGNTWSDPVAPHRDGTATEHGFVSMVPHPDGSFTLVWLDGRETGGEGHGGAGGGAMTLRSATLGSDGRVTPDLLVDDRVCDCCPTATARLGDGSVLTAYRDRSDSEVRDISVCRLGPEAPPEPVRVHEDRWEIAGCPVNGPALVARDDFVACAWFTMDGGEKPEVRFAISRDGGRSFETPLRIDHGDPIGRCDLALVEDGSLLVTWLESAGDEAEIRIRRVSAAGRMDPSRVAARTAPSRASGIPRVARFGTETFLAWTEPGEAPRVRTARMP